MNFNGQCFPLYWYERGGDGGWIRRDGITDWALSEARSRYGAGVQKEDVFYYVYGCLHSPSWRERFSTDLKKSLPRIGWVGDADRFWAFSKAGRALADLHVNYERVEAWEGVEVRGEEYGLYLVEKMVFAKKAVVTGNRRSDKDDRTTIVYNRYITISNVPERAYEYVVNGKSAIEWVMEEYR
ncbi:MAG: hypothetical protein NZ534_13385, partial [Bacteroidia bacterium]|nr:hypothetical protein [Bacteroidia bacterium]